MTTADLLTTLRRRWYVVALGLVLLGGALVRVSSTPGVYWAQVDVVILAPHSVRYPNTIEQTSQSLVSMAGLVERDVNRGVAAPATSSSGVTLAGEGIRDGYAIKLPNDGGQWANNFDRAVLDIQVVGSEPRAVRAKLAVLVRRVEDTLRQRQDSQQVSTDSRITASSAPASPAVFAMTGSPAKALGAALLLGGGLIVVATIGADRVLLRTARRRRRGVTIARSGVLT